MGQPVNGMLVINKPRGMISKDVSRMLTRRFGKIKLGHVGTLDPAAAGVLPLLIGSATRLQDQLLGLPKTYRFTMVYGSETDSLDSDGTEIRSSEKKTVALDDLLAVLPRFRGEITQLPPLYSAVKVNGRPLYSYAREGRGDEIDLESLTRQVKIIHLELIEHHNHASTLEACCSKGTYIRSLARDIAYALNTLATVTDIVRVRAAGVNLAQAVTPEQVVDEGNLETFLVPVESMDLGLERWSAEEPHLTKKLKQGQKLLVRREYFAKSISENCIDSLSMTRPWSVLLMGEDGRAYGIGEVKEAMQGVLSIQLKRGLI